MADSPPAPRISYAHTSYLFTFPSPALAERAPDSPHITQAMHRKPFLRGAALALLPSLVAFGLGFIIGKADFLAAVGFMAWLGILFNPVFALGAAIGLMPNKASRAVGFGLIAGLLISMLLDWAIIIQLLSMAGLEM